MYIRKAAIKVSRSSTEYQRQCHSIQTAMFDMAKEAIKRVNKDNSLNRGWITILHTWGSEKQIQVDP
ncbi:MAG: hypothetical protein JXJ04_09615 [Spirochaetales bacterium]|nr:hypothetical protein [Spirochaetales bacterium]